MSGPRVSDEQARALAEGDPRWARVHGWERDLAADLLDARKALRRADVIAAAWILDRAEQYDNGSGYRAALENVAHGMLAGEAQAAYAHGELDDILGRWVIARAALEEP